MPLKVVTWNVNSIKSRLEHLLSFIKKEQPDVIALQELKCIDSAFPASIFADEGYNIYTIGQKAYNGVAILSRIPAETEERNFEGNPIPEQARFIKISFSHEDSYFQVISLYAPNGGEVGSDKFKIKLDFYDAFTAYLAKQNLFDEKWLIGADYNIAPFNIDVYDPKVAKGSTCFSEVEKQKMRTILNKGFVDCYRLIYPKTQEFSWWDYRAGAFQQNKGYRIDTILANPLAANDLVSCSIDLDTRSQPRPSDHAPVIATLV